MHVKVLQMLYKCEARLVFSLIVNSPKIYLIRFPVFCYQMLTYAEAAEGQFSLTHIILVENNDGRSRWVDSRDNEEVFWKGSLSGFLFSIPLLTLALGAAGAPANGAMGSEQSHYSVIRSHLGPERE